VLVATGANNILLRFLNSNLNFNVLCMLLQFHIFTHLWWPYSQHFVRFVYLRPPCFFCAVSLRALYSVFWKPASVFVWIFSLTHLICLLNCKFQRTKKFFAFVDGDNYRNPHFARLMDCIHRRGRPSLCTWTISLTFW